VVSAQLANFLPYDARTSFSVTYRDPDGCADIEWVEAYFGTTSSATQARFRAHVSNYPPSLSGPPYVYLYKGFGQWTKIPYWPAYPQTASNGIATLAGLADSGAWRTTWTCINQTDLKVTWAFKLKQGMAGSRGISATVWDQMQAQGAAKQVGTVTVKAPTPTPPPGQRGWRFSGHVYEGKTKQTRTPLKDVSFALIPCKPMQTYWQTTQSAADGSYLINVGENGLSATDRLCLEVTGPAGRPYLDHEFPWYSKATLTVIEQGTDSSRAKLVISAPGYSEFCTGGDLIGWQCPAVIAFDDLDLWFLPKGSPPPLATSTPDASATPGPTRAPTPTVTPTPIATPVNQPHKLVGNVCVFADKFETKSGTTTATGKLFLGGKSSNGKCEQRNYFVDGVTLANHTVVTAKISWKSSGTIDVAGVVQLMPHRIPILADDKMAVNRSSGDISMSGTLEKYVGKLFPKTFQLPDNFGIHLSVIKDYVELTGTIKAPNIPENPNFSFTAHGRIKGNGDLALVVDSPTLQFNLAGGTLKAENLSITTEGVLAIGKATLTFKGIPPIVVQGLTLGGDGLQFKRLAGGYNFNIPYLNLGNFFIIEGPGNKKLQPLRATLHIELLNSGKSFVAGMQPDDVTITAVNSQYKIELIGQMRLPTLPGNSNVKVDNLKLFLQKDARDKTGKLAANIGLLHIQVAGRPFDMHNLSFTLVQLPVAAASRAPGLAALAPSGKFSYQLISKRTDFKMPAAWGLNSTVFLQDVRITDKSPYIQFKQAGAKFSVDKTFWLGGKASQDVGVAFKVTDGKLLLKNSFDKYSVQLTAEITFMLGGQKSTVGNVGGKVTLTIDENGKVKTDILGAKLGIAGVQLAVDTLKYEDEVFSAGKASIALPKSWGGGSMMAVKNLRITKDEIKWDNINAEVNIKDINLKPVMRLQNLKVKLNVNAKSEFEWEIWGKVNILPVNLEAAQAAGTYLTAQEVEGVSAALHVKIDKTGKVSGEVSGFSLELIGMKVAVKKATWTDKIITVTEVSASLPPTMGGVSFALFGMTIGGPKGFDVKGGKFNIDHFTFAGVGVEKAHGEFKQLEEGHYTFGAGAKLNFNMFSVTGEFTMEVKQKTFYLRHVLIVYEGTPPAAIGPLGSTGLYIVKIGGSFNLSENDMKFSVMLGIATAGQVNGVTLLKATGQVTLHLKPEFKITTSANLYLLGYKLLKVDATMSPTGFSTRAELNLAIVQIVGYMAFGIDKDKEFTLASGISASFLIKKNSIWGWLPFWGDVRVGPVNGEVGKFRHNNVKVWGGQGLLSVAGYKVWGFVSFSPLKFDGGGGSSPYKVICPAGHNCGFGNKMVLARLAQEGGRTDVLVDVRPSRQIALIETVNALNWENAENLVAIQPDGQRLALTPTISHKEGNEFKKMYVIDRPQVGRWTLQPQAGNTVAALGTDPEPALTMRVEQMGPGAMGAQRIRMVQGSPAHMYGDDSPEATQAMQTLAVQRPLNLTQEGWLRITWQSHDETNLDSPDPVTVQLYAEDHLGKRWPITTTHALNGSYDWQPAIPGGVYTFTVAANDGHNMPVISQVAFNYQDATPPASPKNVTARVDADGAATVSWDSAASDPDVEGYIIDVSTGEVITVTHPISQVVVGTLDPDEAISARVSAYDYSDNVGQGVEVAMRSPQLQLIAQMPAEGETEDRGGQVTAAFNQPVKLRSFHLQDANGREIPGVVQGLTYDLGAIIPIAEPVWGVRFIPERGWLPPGAYTAQVEVTTDLASSLQMQSAGLLSRVAPAGSTSSFRWSFTIQGEPARIFMPLVAH
jgi:hypothetical protein